MIELMRDAVSLGSVYELEEIIKKGVNPNTKDSEGFTPLHVAASVNEKPCLKLLLEAGSTIDAVDDYGNTALHIACERGSEQCIKELLLHGARTDIKNHKKKTPQSLIRNKMLLAKFKAYEKGAKERAENGRPVLKKQVSAPNPKPIEIPKFSKEDHYKVQTLLEREETLIARERSISSREKQLEILEKDMSKRSRILDVMDKELNDSEQRLRDVVERHSTLEIESALIVTNPKSVRIIKEIGKGGFATVYKATWMNMAVAMKKILAVEEMSVHLTPEDRIDLFHRELKIMSRLRHPNIVTVMGCCLNPFNMFILMELCHTDLFSLLRSSNKPQPVELLTYAIDAAQALAYMHALPTPVLHRDIKSSNMLITDRKILKLGDFGYCTIKDEKAFVTSGHRLTENANKGTPAYMAPECLTNEDYSKYSDVFSFGVVLWEIVTGLIPWDKKTPETIYAELTTGSRLPIPSKSAFPSELLELIRECWLEQSTSRPTMRTVLKTLKQILKKMNG